MKEYIQFSNVKKRYTMGEVQISALDGVDFSIHINRKTSTNELRNIRVPMISLFYEGGKYSA